MGSGDVLGVVSGNDVSRSEDEVLFVLLFTLFYSIILFYVFIFFVNLSLSIYLILI